jgi:hypothetical protein
MYGPVFTKVYTERDTYSVSVDGKIVDLYQSTCLFFFLLEDRTQIILEIGFDSMFTKE